MSTDQDTIKKTGERVSEGLSDVSQAAAKVGQTSTDLALAFGTLGLAAASAAYSVAKFRALFMQSQGG